jgi:phosphopantothenoylcysteine decarboxylase/phosphopantothenate--cysteine ligase
LLQGKKILLGVTGSIAAYKSAVLCRLLVKQGAEVQVVFSDSTKDFITPLTLSTLSKKAVLSSFTKSDETGEWNNHVDLGLWADLMLIAPCTANTMAKMANGICDNLLLATYLSARCKAMIAPAMDLDMWLHPSTQNNLNKLKDFGVLLVEPESGALASGLDGKGRMAEPENILHALDLVLGSPENQKLKGKAVLITAGPTYEAIDPVRFIGNHSSGKMGYALAQEAVNLGASVTLVSGPSSLVPPKGLKEFVKITSAQELFEACNNRFNHADLTIKAAAVADYTPEVKASQKIKKQEASLNISLKKTPDILAGLGATKKNGQILVGFALETFNEETFALDKLKRKNLDAIVLNSLNDKGAGFGGDTNKVTLYFKDKPKVEIPLKSKTEVAKHILSALCELF